MSETNSHPGIFTKVFAIVYVSLLLILTGLMIFSFVIGPYIVFNNPLDSLGAGEFVGPFVIYFFGLPLFIVPIDITIGTSFIGLWTIYLVLFVVVFRGPRLSFFKAIKKIVYNGRIISSDNNLVTMVSSFSALTFVLVTIEYIQSSLGIRTGNTPEIDYLAKFTLITYAPLAEEIGFRVGLVGLVALYLSLGSKPGVNALKTLWHPQKYLRIIFSTNGNYKRNIKLIWAMVIISSLLFGMAHLYGGAWEIGKVSLASFAGIILGITYVRNGLPAAILLHWSFNYFTTSYEYFEKGFEIAFISDFMYTVILLSGIITSVLIVKRRLRR